MNNSKANQKILVRELGEQIGYGNLMHLASECWQESLKAKGLPPGGAFSVGLPYDLLAKKEKGITQREYDLRKANPYDLNDVARFIRKGE